VPLEFHAAVREIGDELEIVRNPATLHVSARLE
jgi:hypothetical protein